MALFPLPLLGQLAHAAGGNSSMACWQSLVERWLYRSAYAGAGRIPRHANCKTPQYASFTVESTWMETLLQRNLETYVASIRKDAQLQWCSLILFMFPLSDKVDDNASRFSIGLMCTVGWAGAGLLNPVLVLIWWWQYCAVLCFGGSFGKVTLSFWVDPSGSVQVDSFKGFNVVLSSPLLAYREELKQPFWVKSSGSVVRHLSRTTVACGFRSCSCV